MTRLPVRTIWAGNKTMACKKRRNSILINSAPRTIGEEQPEPRLQIPGQGGHNHVGQVAEQIIHRHAHGIDAVFKLLDHVLLIAASVGQTDDLLAGVIEPVTVIPGQPLTLLKLRLAHCPKDIPYLAHVGVLTGYLLLRLHLDDVFPWKDRALSTNSATDRPGIVQSWYSSENFGTLAIPSCP